MRFSQRIGKRPVKTVLQIDSIDIELKNRLWNILRVDFLEQFSSQFDGTMYPRSEVCLLIWREFFNEAIEEAPLYDSSIIIAPKEFMQLLKRWFYEELEWFEIYDLIEFISNLEVKYYGFHQIQSYFINLCNQALQIEASAFRIIEKKVAKISSEQEIQAVETALTSDSNAVTTHLKAALDFLTDRKNPNYRNSIKESISAVEALCKKITGEEHDTLGKALNEIEKKYGLHKSLKVAFSALYGYTNQADGIRHALLDDKNNELSSEDAMFMFVTCSAFINYLNEKFSR